MDGVETEGVASAMMRVLLQEDINFLLTNRIPRRYATLFMGWFSRIEIGWIKHLSLATFRLFADDLDLAEAKTQDFASLHECFIRELKEGARPIDPDPTIAVSPCDAIVGAYGRIDGTRLIQAKGLSYTLSDLLGDEELVRRHRNGLFITLRLKSNFYHRFHAPADCRVRSVVYVGGDTWNVNPIAVARVEQLFCKNERAVMDLELDAENQSMTLVPVAAILVGGIKLNCLEEPLDLRHRGRKRIPCDRAFEKGAELGYFQAGSTILLFASGDLSFTPNVRAGARVRVGEPLFSGLCPRAAQALPRARANVPKNGDVDES